MVNEVSYLSKKGRKMNRNYANIYRENLLKLLVSDKISNDDCTYEVFKKYIFEVIPRAINETISSKKEDVSTVLNFKLINDNLWLVSSNNMNLGVVNSNDFFTYLVNIPSIIICNCSNGNYLISYDLNSITNYYYEELQREDYQARKMG